MAASNTTYPSVSETSRRRPYRQLTDEQRLKGCNLDWWTKDPKVVKSPSGGKEPTLTEAIETRNAELRDPEKKWQRQNYNSTLYKRRDGLLKKIHQFTMLSNQKNYTPVFFATQLFGRWYIYNSEEGRSDDWFPSKDFLSKTIPTPRVHAPVKEENARLQTLVDNEEKKQAKLASQARREEILKEKPTDPASIEKLLNAMAEEKAELAKAKFHLKRGQLASAIGAVHRQDRAKLSSEYISGVLAARDLNESQNTNANHCSDSYFNGAESSSAHGDTAVQVNHDVSPLTVNKDHMAQTGITRDSEVSTGFDRSISHLSCLSRPEDQNNVITVELPVTERGLSDYLCISEPEMSEMDLDEHETDDNRVFGSGISQDSASNGQRASLDEGKESRTLRDHSQGYGESARRNIRSKKPPVPASLVSAASKPRYRSSARNKMRQLVRMRGNGKTARGMLQLQ